MTDLAKIHFAFQNTVLFSVSALQEGDDNIQENSIQTLLICLDVPHGTVSVFCPEIWILESEFKALFYNTGCYSEILARTNTIQFCTCLCKMHPWGILGGWRSSIPDWAEVGGYMDVHLQLLFSVTGPGKYWQLFQTNSFQRKNPACGFVTSEGTQVKDKNTRKVCLLWHLRIPSVWHHEVPLITHPRNRSKKCKNALYNLAAVSGQRRRIIPVL